jgi:hypothetical protein
MQAQAHASFDAAAVEARAIIPAGIDDAPIRFVASDSGVGLAYRPYRLHIGLRLVLGRTDENGFTAQLNGAERAALTAWDVD